MADYPVEMVNVKTGDVRVVETAIELNNLATSGYKVKNKKEEADDFASDSSAHSDAAVSDSQTSEGSAGEPAESATENAVAVPAETTAENLNLYRRGRK